MTPDALHQSWILRAPPLLQPYLRLARLDRPIGTWLLFWPCIWGSLIAAPAMTVQVAWLGLLFWIGSIAMRGAGCVWNDILDRNLDAQVERTRARPLPAGEVSLRAAVVFLLLLCACGLAVLAALPRSAQIVALCALPLVAFYPLMKRITWWPQAWLGLTFNWGIWVGAAAMEQAMSLSVLCLYIAGLFWTLGYDTIYALQDMEDDALAGVKSSARRLGARVRTGVGLFYGLAAVFVTASLLVQGPAHLALASVGFTAHLAWQWHHWRITPVLSPALALRLFRSNFWAGALLAAGLAVFRLF